ncbi:FAST kinase domain-containing protein 3, mitochondrial-like [Myxocyprinus asiaticus]|uniref:FAST kinase domain-containing protein 3, mitochondrial-like n=1 Tax=Myxocyprinus asiaticus TaxID=70543 RepID=UPI0022233A2B|nr:FAST kinase domain-containing protein 3, mitochondrial-like [Myxocyprinus asiaticus]XP_051576982.1 FAST kinase domain-containing protein 3, mitochondrial-like [Myxocyprinus asiaticus]
MAKTLALRWHLLRHLGAQVLQSLVVFPGKHLCSPCLRTSSVYSLSQRGVCTTTRDPLFLVAGPVRPYQELLVSGNGLSWLHHLTSDEDHTFTNRLSSCTTSQEVLRLLRSHPELSGAASASVLHRLADLEKDGAGGLQNPQVLLSDVVLNKLCQRLVQESAVLEDDVVIRALVGCTRLYLDPWSRLVVRLVSESQKRLDSGRLSVEALCGLARALFALEGPDCGMLKQAMTQLQNKDPARCSATDLVAVYRTLASGLGEDGRYLELLNEMNAQALRLAHRMDPVVVSEVLGALVTLGQTQALPLVIALCKQAVRHVQNFADAELTVVLSALMHYGHSDHFLVEALERHVPKIAFSAHAETITKVMQYFGQRRILSPPVFNAVAESFVYRAEEYSTWQVSQQIVALGVLGYVPPDAGRLFRKVELVLNARFSQFHPKALLDLLHACTLLQRYPLNFVSKVFSPYFMQQLQAEEDSGMDRTVLAQLTQLYMTVKLECPFYDGLRLSPKFRVKSFLAPRQSLETQVEPQLYNAVKYGLVDLLGARSYFASRVLTPYCYTLDVEIKLDEEGYVLPACHIDEVHKRIAVCIDGPKRFAENAKELLGKESIKQRHLRILGYDVVQIPYYEFEKLKDRKDVVEYLHKKIFPHSYRLSW